jgi:hypothetical protein
VPEELKPYVNDYKVNVFEIAHLTDEQVNMFKGDFKLVADYFVHTKESKEYEPMPGKIKHLWEILCLMQALTGDNRFEEMYSDFKEKESVSMCEVVDNFINKGVSKGVRQEKIRFIIKLHNKNIANSEIADYAELTEEEVEEILKENNLE